MLQCRELLAQLFSAGKSASRAFIINLQVGFLEMILDSAALPKGEIRPGGLRSAWTIVSTSFSEL